MRPTGHVVGFMRIPPLGRLKSFHQVLFRLVWIFTLSVLSHRSRVLSLDRLFRRGSQRIASSLVIASVKESLDLREQKQCMDVLTAFDYHYMVPRCC